MLKLSPRNVPPWAHSRPAGTVTWSCTRCPACSYFPPATGFLSAKRPRLRVPFNAPPTAPHLVCFPPPLAGRRRDCAARRDLPSPSPGVPGAQSRRVGATRPGPYGQDGEWGHRVGLDKSLSGILSLSVSRSLRVSLLSLSLSVFPYFSLPLFFLVPFLSLSEPLYLPLPPHLPLLYVSFPLALSLSEVDDQEEYAQDARVNCKELISPINPCKP